MKRTLLLALLALASPLAHAGYSLGAPVTHPIGSWPDAVAIGDVDGDGRKDVVVTTTFYFDAANDWAMFVYLQRPDGTLATPRKISYLQKAQDTGIAIGDLDGDGRNEIVVGQGSGITTLRWNPGALKPRWIPTNNGVSNVALLDVNRDGRMDIVGLGDGMTVYIGDGRGGVERQVHVEVVNGGGGGGDMESGDYNGDGFQDIAILPGSNFYPVLVFYNDGSDHFAPAQAFDPNPLSNSTGAALAAGDFNGDGRTDLAARSDDYAMAVFSQTAEHTFGAAVPLPYLYEPQGAVGTDLDGDGDDDLVVLQNGTNLSVFLQGAGGLGAATLVPTAMQQWPNSMGIAVGDINGDGCADVALAHMTAGLIVHPGIGCPKPDLAPSLGLASSAVALRIDNFGEGDADAVEALLALSLDEGVLTVGEMPSGCVTEEQAERSATVRCQWSSLAAKTSRTTILPIGVSGGSIRNVLRATVQVTTPTPESNVSNNTAQKVLRAPKPTSTPPAQGAFALGPFQHIDSTDHDEFDSLAIADIDADGRDDLVVATTNGWVGRYQVWVYRQDAEGKLREPLKVAYGTWATSTGLVVTDLDHDAYPDIVVGHEEGLSTVEWNPAQQALVAIKHVRDTWRPRPQRLVALDVNRDGNMDIVSNGMASYLGNGQGGFARTAEIPSVNAGAGLATGDFNGDGWTDLAMISSGMQAPSIFLNDGTDNLADWVAPEARDNADNLAAWVDAGDVNGDGRDDLVTTHGRRDVSVYLQNADGTLSLQPALATDLDPRALAVRDLDADGRDDLLVVHGVLSLGTFLQSKAGALQAEQIWPGDIWSVSATQLLATGDLDGDGCIDTAIARKVQIAIYPSVTCNRHADLATSVGLTPNSFAVRIDNLGARARGATNTHVAADLRTSLGTISMGALPAGCSYRTHTAMRAQVDCVIGTLPSEQSRTLTFGFSTTGLAQRATLVLGASARSDAQETNMSNNTTSRVLRSASVVPTLAPARRGAAARAR